MVAIQITHEDYETYTGNGMSGGLREGFSSFINLLQWSISTRRVAVVGHHKTERGHAPEDLHVNVRFEDDEEVRIIVRVVHGAAIAEVYRAIRAMEPLSVDVLHAPVAHRERVRQRAEIPCGATTIVSEVPFPSGLSSQRSASYLSGRPGCTRRLLARPASCTCQLL